MKKKVLIVISVLLGLAVFFLIAKTTVAPGGVFNQSDDDSQKQISTQPVPFDKSKRSLSDPASIWVVVNKQRPLNPLTYVPSDLVDAGGGNLMRQGAAGAFSRLQAAAKVEGLIIIPLSGYRSYDTQIAVYNREVSTNGQVVADTQSAKPGHSEHQTGFAIDVGGGGCGIELCFGETAEGKWLAANAHKYGFIIRYPKGKDTITGYRYEPWHIRYFGKDLASELHKTGQTPEEFFDLGSATSY